MTIRRIRVSLENVSNQSLHYYSKEASGKSKTVRGTQGRIFIHAYQRCLLHI